MTSANKVFSADGYLIDQNYTGACKYGHFTSDFNGCGWIAMFNLLKAAGKQTTVEQVHSGLAAILPYAGFLGTPLRTMRKYLAQQNISYTEIKGKQKISAAIAAYDCGILRFLRKKELHFVAFTRIDDHRLRFFNVYDGKEDYICTLEEFLADKISSIPSVVGFLVKK